MMTTIRYFLLISLTLLAFIAPVSHGHAAESARSVEIKNNYIESARSGDPDALYQLGLMYLTGNTVEKNEKVAGSFLFHAAQKGNLEAKSLLAGLNFVPERQNAPISKSKARKPAQKTISQRKAHAKNKATQRLKSKKPVTKQQKRKIKPNTSGQPPKIKTNTARKVAARPKAVNSSTANQKKSVEITSKANKIPSKPSTQTQLKPQLAKVAPKPQNVRQSQEKGSITALIAALVMSLMLVLGVCAISLSSNHRFSRLYWIKVDLRHRLNLFFYKNRNLS